MQCRHLFDFIISKALKTDAKVVVLNDEWRAGVMGTDGLAVKVYNGVIESAERLVDLLTNEDKPGNGHCMQTY